MIWQLAVAGVMALAYSAPAAKTALWVVHPYVEMVNCDLGMGTAFQISPGKFLSVNHVTRLGNCHIRGHAITIDYADEEADFSIVTIPEKRKGGIAISCAGFFNREYYWALGHAGGLPAIRAVVIRADAFRTIYQGAGRFVAFSGAETVIPGQSGGPVLDSSGRAVGVINAYNRFTITSFSRPLKETAACRYVAGRA